MLFPLRGLLRCQLVDLVTFPGLHLVDTGVLELAPGLADAAGGFGAAVVVDRLLLPVGHLIDIVSRHERRLRWPFAVIVIYCNYHCKHAANSATAAFEPAMLKGARSADQDSHHWRRAGGIAAGPTAAPLRNRQCHPGTPDRGLCARPHPRRPA